MLPRPGSKPAARDRASGPVPGSRLTTWSALLALAALLTGWLRWETRSRLVYGWDTVHYLLAQDRYDIRLHSPTPPGSFYYVYLAKALRPLVGGDAHAALLLLGALSAALLVVAAFFLARELDPHRRPASGWLALLITATAPLFWFFGSVGLNYGPNGALTTLAALLFLRTARRADRFGSPLGSGIVLGLIGGFRPTDVAFLLPAYLWALWRFSNGGARWKTVALSLGLCAAVNLGWLLPSALLSGGFTEYLRMLKAQEPLLDQTGVFHGGLRALRVPLLTHRRCLEGVLGIALVPLALGALTWLLRRPKPAPEVREALLFSTLFTVPAFAFYLLLHFNSPGYALTYSGLLAALAAVGCVASLRTRHAGMLAAMAVLIGVGNTAMFWFGWSGPGSAAHRALSGAELRDHDRYYGELRAFLNREYGARPVRILSSWNFTEGLRVVQTALPDRPGAVAQPMNANDYLPDLLRHLPWFKLLSPDQVRAEGLPVIAVVRTSEDPGFYEHYFPGQWEVLPIGPGHIVYRLRQPAEQGKRPTSLIQ